MRAWVTRLSHSIAQIAGMTTLSAIQNIVVLMLENRSFDHMLGMLYTAQGNVSPAGQPYEGLTGNETNPGPDGRPVRACRPS